MPSRSRRLLPTQRSVAVAVAIALGALAAYAAVRETRMFAIGTIEVRGADGALATQVRAALAPVVGESLVALDAADVVRLTSALPRVAGVTYDRAFPHTLVVKVEPEVPVAVLRRGRDSWLVSRRGRVIDRFPAGAFPALPRVWVDGDAPVERGGLLAAADGGDAVTAVAAAGAALRGRIATIRVDGKQATYVLRGRVELRVGRVANVPLKLEIGRRIAERVPNAAYVDVSVPERPVVRKKPQLSTRG